MLGASYAHASGFATARFGGEHGSVVTTNPTAVYYNPAGIAESKGIHLFLDGSLALRSASYQHTPADSDVPEPPDAQGANTEKATLFNVLVVPMVGASANFGGFAVGAGVYVPLGGTSIWDKNDNFKNDPVYAGPYDGGNRWYSIEGTIKSTYYTVATAYKIPDSGLSLGVSGNLVESVVNTMRARVADGSDDLASEGRSYMNVSGWQVSFGLGAMYEAMPDEMWFAFSYQSRPNVSGGMVLKGTLRNKLGVGDTSQEIRAEQDMPDIYRLGWRFHFDPAWELRVFGDYTRWSALKNQCLGEADRPCEIDDATGGRPADNDSAIQNLPRHWKDAFGVRLGVSHYLGDNLEFMGGVGYDGNAIPDEAMDPALMDFEKFSGSLGARYHVFSPLFAALTYTHIFYLPRDTGGKNGNADWQIPSKGPDAGGQYKQTIGVVNANLELVF